MTNATGVEQVADIKAAAAELFDSESGICCDADDVVLTRDTIADFQARWGCGVSNIAIKQANREFREIQPNGKGTPRVNLYVVDMGAWRATVVK